MSKAVRDRARCDFLSIWVYAIRDKLLLIVSSGNRSFYQIKYFSCMMWLLMRWVTTKAQRLKHFLSNPVNDSLATLMSLRTHRVMCHLMNLISCLNPSFVWSVRYFILAFMLWNFMISAFYLYRARRFYFIWSKAISSTFWMCPHECWVRQTVPLFPYDIFFPCAECA